MKKSPISLRHFIRAATRPATAKPARTRGAAGAVNTAAIANPIPLIATTRGPIEPAQPEIKPPIFKAAIPFNAAAVIPAATPKAFTATVNTPNVTTNCFIGPGIALKIFAALSNISTNVCNAGNKASIT